MDVLPEILLAADPVYVEEGIYKNNIERMVSVMKDKYEKCVHFALVNSHAALSDELRHWSTKLAELRFVLECQRERLFTSDYIGCTHTDHMWEQYKEFKNEQMESIIQKTAEVYFQRILRDALRVKDHLAMKSRKNSNAGKKPRPGSNVHFVWKSKIQL